MCKWMRQPFCFISYLLLALSGILFFFHCTFSPGLDNSQQRETAPPSSASTLCSSVMKNGAGSVDGEKQTKILFEIQS